MITTKKFQRTILSWYRNNRRDLPWRTPVRWSKNLPLYPRKLPDGLTPYHILVSEIMLQQTQIPRVLIKYPLFLKKFPTLKTLAKAKTEGLFSVWQGMGYWRRALYLRECAEIIVKNYNGAMPSNPEVLEKLPGIGPYTARAIACFAFQNDEAFIDTNIRRIFIHFFFPNEKNISDASILAIAQKNLWQKNPRQWHYALMDYGSLVLGKQHELNKQSKHFHRQSPFAGSFRSFRSAIISLLLAQGPSSIQKITEHLQTIRGYKNSKNSPKKILEALCKDNVVECKGKFYRLRG